MAKVLAVILAALMFLSWPEATWESAAARVERSIVRLSNDNDVSCTGFVSDNRRDYVIAVNHCLGPNMRVDRLKARVVVDELAQDLLVLWVNGLDKPALRLASQAPGAGAFVGAYGYGLAKRNPMFRLLVVSTPLMWDLEEWRGEWMLFDKPLVPAMSGGPIFNIYGEVVSVGVASWPVHGLGVGVGAGVVRKRLESYFES